MTLRILSLRKIYFLAGCLALLSINGSSQSIGIFDGHTDVGKILHPGSAIYDSNSQEYLVSGSGSNIWALRDDFHYLWKRAKGNFILQARGSLLGKGVDAHRKFGWMIRTSLDSSAAMVAATVHGDGLTSLQYRKAPQTNVEETKSAVSGPDVIQLEKKVINI